LRAADGDAFGGLQPLLVGQFAMLKLGLPVLAFILGLGAVACSAGDTPNDTGGTGGSGGTGSGATGGASGAGGACKDPPGGSGTCPKFDYANYNPCASPTLKNDIQPIFTNSCALSSSCHQNGSSHHPNLGLSTMQLDGGKPTDAMLTMIMAELNKPSTQVAGKNIVASGKPEDSYLMNKIEGTNNCSGFVCMGPDKCGTQMPGPDDAALEKPRVELIRAWIKKGTPM
jgi:hypothetical protein